MSTVVLRSKARRPIAPTIQWTPRNKKIAVVASIVLGIGGVIFGVWTLMGSLPPRLPQTAGEAIAVMKTSRFDRLDDERKLQYTTEAARLIAALPDEERRAMFQDQESREAMRKVFEEQSAEAAKRLARGEDPRKVMESMRPPGMRGPGGAGGPGGPGGPGGGQRPGGGPPGMNGQMPENMRARIASGINNMLAGGNAQASALRGEMFRKMQDTFRGGGAGGGNRQSTPGR